MDLEWIPRNATMILHLLATHIWLTIIPTAIGLAVSVPLGRIAAKHSRLYVPIVQTTSLFYTIPSLALFVLLPKILGTRILDPVNVVVALTIYTVALLVRNVADALISVPSNTRQAAQAMGYSSGQLFWHVELPMCIPALISGLRVVVVSNVSIVTMAALIGVDQLGSLFTLGFTRRLYLPIIVGLIVCLFLAVVLDRLLDVLGRVLSPWQRKGAM